ncbi:hypothetical protein AB0E01_41415 [Nocardia vinacea]
MDRAVRFAFHDMNDDVTAWWHVHGFAWMTSIARKILTAEKRACPVVR